MGTAGVILGTILLAIAAAVVVVFLVVPLARVFTRVVGHIFATIGRWITDIFRLIGTVLVIPVFMILTVLSVVVGRWSASAHYGRAVSGEIKSAGLCVYRILVGHPLRLVGLHVLVDGFERRLPEVVAAAPGRDRPRGRTNQFDGYTVVGSLKGGGSGGKLYIAQPDELKNAAFVKRGIGNIDQVVIKTFSVHEGSTLPQIIRESRALDAAKRLGLILEHDLTSERFFYVMRYIPGEPLSIVTQRAHADADPDGLGDPALRKLLGYGRDVLVVLDRYHTGGLWHKDIKPDNIIVDHDEAHIVDLGLITPLRSAMTLTTHGTEYFRDPELVRMALKGVKVNEVNGEKFDIYAAAAVMYATVEGSFPAHGGLSQITRRCPEAIRWIIRRGMTDYDKRYETAAEMLADLEVVLAAPDLFAVRPAMLPSVGGAATEPADAHESPADFAPPAAPSPPQAQAVPPGRDPSHAGPPPSPAPKPKVRVANWWSGRYDIDGVEDLIDGSLREADEAINAAKADPGAGRAHRATPRPRREPTRRPAHEQRKNARARAAERRKRAVNRVAERRRNLRTQRDRAAGLNPGVAIAIGCVVGLISIPVSVVMLSESDADPSIAAVADHADPHTDARSDAPLPPAPPVAAVAVAAGDALRVLVVTTFNRPIEPSIEAGIEQTVATLRGLGFQVADTTGGSPELTEDLGVELLADVRAARFIGSSSAADAARQMRSWFSDAGLGYDALVLIEPDPDSLITGDPFARALVVDDDSYGYERVLHPDSVARRVVNVIDD